MANNKHRGSTLDSFLEEEGLREQFEGQAIKEVIAWQLGEAMKEQNLSKKRMAELMNTSRAQLDRLLDPRKGNVTLDTIQKAAAIVGRQLHIELR
jgi:predicted XRE-type DNA-binding protein